VRELFKESNWIRWGSLNSILPILSEANPNEFLLAVENAINASSSPFDELFDQEDAVSFFSSSVYVCRKLLNVDLEVNSLTISKLLLAVQCELFQVLLVASQRKLMYAASKEGKYLLVNYWVYWSSLTFVLN
jgi:hypothetical protein